MRKLQTLLIAVAFGMLATTLPACDGGSSTPDSGNNTNVDGGTVTDAGHNTDAGHDVDAGHDTDAGTPDAGEPECFTNPTTHYEIINGCTDAVKIDKTVTLPLVDGGLPALP